MKFALFLFLSSLTCSLWAQKPFDGVAERRYLLAGVTEIPKMGAPGPLYVSSQNAFPVIISSTGKRQPLMVAGRSGLGRIIGFGHDGYVAKEGANNAPIRILMSNAVKWAAKRKASPKILVKDSQEWATYFESQTFQVKKLAWHETITPEIVAQVDVIFLNPERLDATKGELTTVQEAIEGGKGAILGGLGWGWKQLNPTKDLKNDQKANILCAKAGFEWIDGTLAGDKFSCEVELPALLDYENAKKYVLTNDYATADQKDYATALATVFSNLAQKGREPFAIPSDFPGNAPEDSPTVTKQITIDTKSPYWHCTGLYAQAGSLITITANNLKSGAFKIRIGTHTDQLYHLKEWKRHPEVSLAYGLNAGKNEVFNPFGGMIYIEVPENYKGDNLILQIAGGVEAPFFKLGKTTLAEWQKIRQAPAPWGEIEGNEFAFTIESEYLRNLGNPNEVAEFWDKIQKANRDLVDWNPNKPHKMRLAFDRQISLGYMHSGYPIMALSGKEYVDEQANIINLEDTKKWGFVHELGHNHQEPEWTFEGTVEVTCNLFSMYALETVMNAKNEQAMDGLRYSVLKKLWNDYLKSNKSFELWKKEPFIALMMYRQLIATYGWDALKEVFKKYHQTPKASLPKKDDDKRDFWLKTYSEVVGENLSDFFDAWNMPVSEQAKNSLKHLPKADIKKLMENN